MRAQVDFVLERRLGNGSRSEDAYHQYKEPVDEVHARTGSAGMNLGITGFSLQYDNCVKAPPPRPAGSQDRRFERVHPR
jgi:hypothetical protein